MRLPKPSELPLASASPQLHLASSLVEASVSTEGAEVGPIETVPMLSIPDGVYGRGESISEHRYMSPVQTNSLIRNWYKSLDEVWREGCRTNRYESSKESWSPHQCALSTQGGDLRPQTLPRVCTSNPSRRDAPMPERAGFGSQTRQLDQRSRFDRVDIKRKEVWKRQDAEDVANGILEGYESHEHAGPPQHTILSVPIH